MTVTVVAHVLDYVCVSEFLWLTLHADGFSERLLDNCQVSTLPGDYMGCNGKMSV